jgi:outer membrane protein assembly factor BamB
VGGGLVYQADGDVLRAFDAATGDERWRYRVSITGAAHAPALADGVAYVGGDDPRFFTVDVVTGTLVWKGDTGDDQTRTAVVAEGVAYIGGSPDVGTGHLTPTVLDGVGYSGGGTSTMTPSTPQLGRSAGKPNSAASCATSPSRAAWSMPSATATTRSRTST